MMRRFSNFQERSLKSEKALAIADWPASTGEQCEQDDDGNRHAEQQKNNGTHNKLS
jgi:hypothetical protein